MVRVGHPVEDLQGPFGPTATEIVDKIRNALAVLDQHREGGLGILATFRVERLQQSNLLLDVQVFLIQFGGHCAPIIRSFLSLLFS